MNGRIAAAPESQVVGLRDRLWRRASSLQARITAIAMLPAIALAILVGGLSILLRLDDLGTGLEQRGLLLARQLASAADYGVFSGNRAALQALAESVAGEPATLAVWILDTDGSKLAAIGLMPDGVQADAEPAQRRVIEHRDWRLFQEPILSPPIPIDDVDPTSAALGARAAGAASGDQAGRGVGVAVVVLSTASIRLEAQRFAAGVIGILLFVMLVSGLFARRMSRRLSQPVVEIAHAVERIGRGDAGVRVAPHRISVLDLLGRGVNEMAARLEHSMQELEDRVQDATGQLVARKEEAERANLAKSKFLAAASHDLRQPMHALGMFVATLSQQPSTLLQKQLITQIDRAVGAMGDLLDSLLDISRLDAGAVETRISMLPLRPLFDRIGNEFAAVAQAKGIELVVRKTSFWVRSDRILLERIVVNLLSNAVRYTERGRIVLAARPCGKQLEQVRIEVRDSGPGIPEDAQEAIFDEFVQLGNPERDRSKGIGLGLAIVTRLTSLLDHRLHLRSAVGAGSTFGVVVPRVSSDEVAATQAAAARFAAHAQRAAASAQANPRATRRQQPGPRVDNGNRQRRDGARRHDAPSGAAYAASVDRRAPEQDAIASAATPLLGRRILVIDDDTMVRESLSMVLKSWGALVATASGDPSLPRKLRDAERPDLILCDLRLENDLDGVQMLSAIRDQLDADIPAVLITGDTDPERTAFAMSSGNPVLHKPVRPAQLRALIRNLLRKTDVDRSAEG
ncbi:MAG: hybrid sensor histidine kinase/response regulator [Burkholderiaceae bacterium]|nr:hybrid sensor histidine kinase/response regulator [Burkholderiaceae bacterium]